MSVEITVKGGRVSFSRWSFRSVGAVWRNRVGPLVLEAMKQEAPVYKYDDDKLSRGHKVGELRESIKMDSSSGGVGKGIEMVFTTDVPYAKYVIKGTKGPYPITPVNALMLHWNRGGEDVYRSQVSHPGIHANDFPKRAVDKVQPLIGRELEVTVAEYIKPTQL